MKIHWLLSFPPTAEGEESLKPLFFKTANLKKSFSGISRRTKSGFVLLEMTNRGFGLQD
jgi:hypothetical protein